jgi:hypothetical protein
MELVKCPQCGRENVSINDLACPQCGFLIRQHFSPETTPQKFTSMDFLEADVDKWIQSTQEENEKSKRKYSKIEFALSLIVLVLSIIKLIRSLF